MEGRSQPVWFLTVTVAAAATVWKREIPCLQQKYEQEMAVSVRSQRVSVCLQAPKCLAVYLPPRYIGLWLDHWGGKRKPVQLELPFGLGFHFPGLSGQCFLHALKFKPNWKYFRVGSIHSVICLIAVWQYEISPECISFTKIIITIATHTTSETQLFLTKAQKQKASTLHIALRAISEVSSLSSNHCVWKRPTDVER